MKLRICTLGVPLFRHGGLDVGEAWSDLDLKKLDKKQIASLRTFVGRFIQIHPADVGNVSAIGLVLTEEGALVEVPQKSTPKTDASKGKE